MGIISRGQLRDSRKILKSVYMYMYVCPKPDGEGRCEVLIQSGFAKPYTEVPIQRDFYTHAYTHICSFQPFLQLLRSVSQSQ